MTQTEAQQERQSWPAGTVIPANLFNDDDHYIYDANTLQLVGHVGSSAGYKPWPKAGQTVARGLLAKYLGLWEAQR